MPFLSIATLSTASEDEHTETMPAEKSPSHSEEGESSAFDRHTFPRDSGCFASSSPASDRSSQQSQSESGIHLDDEQDQEDASIETPKAALKRPQEKSAKSRTLRDQHRITQNDIESLEKLKISNKNEEDSKFDQLVEKYVKSSDEKSSLPPGLVNSARKMFEQ